MYTLSFPPLMFIAQGDFRQATAFKGLSFLVFSRHVFTCMVLL